MDKQKRAIIYCRVSTKRQKDEGYSLGTQLAECKKYAKDNDWVVVGDYDDDHTGFELGRKGLDAARAALRRHEADCIIVHDADRLTRNLAHSLVLREEFSRLKIELHVVKRGKTEDTAEGRLRSNMESVIAEYEREKTRDRSRINKYAKAEVKHVGNAPAYGYRKLGKGKDSRLVIYEPEARVVRLIYRWYIKGDGKSLPLSIRAICKRLAQKGIKTSKGNIAWGGSVIRGMLAREIYIGLVVFGKTRYIEGEDKKKREIKQPPEEWVSFECPELAIIDKRTLEAAKVRMQRNREIAKRNTRHDYLLRGHIRCGLCGRAMAGGSSHQIRGDYRYYFYRCVKADDGYCNCNTIVCHVVDDKVWSWLSGMLSDEKVLDIGLKRMAKRAEEELEPKRAQLADTVSLIGKTESKIKRLTSFIADTEDTTVLEALKANLHSATRERAALVAEKIALEKDLEQKELTTDTQAEIKQAVSKIRKRLETASYADKRYIFEKLGLRVRYCVDGDLRWLEVTCGIAPDGAMLNFESAQSGMRAT
jgi:site-specific DNA recombinase